jgi:predicted nuclease of restriction endonuclease-like (RecB) superfamily
MQPFLQKKHTGNDKIYVPVIIFFKIKNPTYASVQIKIGLYSKEYNNVWLGPGQ